jgi:hypothetical protein
MMSDRTMSEERELQIFKEHIIAEKVVEQQEQRKPVVLKNFNLKEFIEIQLGQRTAKKPTVADWAEHNRLCDEFLKKKPIAEFGLAAMKRMKDEEAEKKAKNEVKLIEEKAVKQEPRIKRPTKPAQLPVDESTIKPGSMDCNGAHKKVILNRLIAV